MTDADGILMGRADLERAFTALGERLARRGVVADLFVVGGAAMALRNLSRFLGRVVQGFVESTVWSGSSGLLIHTVVGGSGGSGCLRTKRSGWRR